MLIKIYYKDFLFALLSGFIISLIDAYFKTKKIKECGSFERLPEFWKDRNFPSWNEILAIPGLIILFLFDYSFDLSWRLYVCGLFIAIFGIEDIMYQYVKILFYSNKIGYKENANWLNAWTTFPIMFLTKFVGQDKTTPDVIYVSGLLGIASCLFIILF